jgi:hypothetical protein
VILAKSLIDEADPNSKHSGFVYDTQNSDLRQAILHYSPLRDPREITFANSILAS